MKSDRLDHALVQRLEAMLAQERKRSDTLLLKYNRLREKLNRVQETCSVANQDETNTQGGQNRTGDFLDKE